MCPPSLHHVTHLSVLEGWALSTTANGRRRRARPTHVHHTWKDGQLQQGVRSPLTHLLDVPVLSSLRPIPVQGSHRAHQGHDQEDAKEYQDLHISYFLHIRSLERRFGGILYESM